MAVAQSTVASVHEAAATLLNLIAELMGTTVGGDPAMAYLSPGLPSFDFACDQACVWNSSIGEEQTSPLTPFPAPGYRPRSGWQNLVSLSAFSGRCIHVGKTTHAGYTPPSGSALSGDAVKVMEDGWAVWEGLHYAIRDDGLFGGTCMNIKFQSMSPITPQGALAGWVAVVQFELGGYDPQP